MRVIHVRRKPLSEGTVAANTLRHGTGGLNINASRIASPGEEITTHTQGRGDDGYAANAVYGDYRGGFKTHQTEGQKLGRWPANVILQHLDGCRCDGVKRVPSNGNFPAQQKTASWKMSSKGKALTPDRTYREGGGETVANWICEPGCPVARLDEQSGVSGDTTEGVNRQGEGGQYATGIYGNAGPEGRTGETRRRIVDRGGASRFYKQVGGKTDG